MAREDITGGIIPDISARLDAVQESLTTLEREISKENRLRVRRIAKSEKASKWARRIAVVGILGACVGGYLGWQGNTNASTARDAADRANEALSLYKDATADARFGSCMQQRSSAVNAIVSSHNHDVILADQIEPPPRAPLTQLAVDRALAALHASDVTNNRKRDCSPTGIADFLSGHGGYEPLPKP